MSKESGDAGGSFRRADSYNGIFFQWILEKAYNNRMTFSDEARQMLAELGPGKRLGTTYDTAWVARLIDHDRSLGGQAMDWLSMHQLPDGSWGAAAPLSYHDRVICTLSAMIALHRHGRRARDQRQIKHGLTALLRLVRGATHGLTADSQTATVGFEWIAPTLVAEAESLGLLQNQGGRILGRMAVQRDAFIATLSPGGIHRESWLAYLAEMAGKDHPELIAQETLQEDNGSVACSPSATAYFALYVKPGDAEAMEYLRRAAPQSLAPHRMPYEVSERLSVIWNLSRASIDHSITALIYSHLAQLSALWRSQSGLSSSAECELRDGELACAGFELLNRFSIRVGMEAVFAYEGENSFRRYAKEPAPSILANVHALSALRQAGFESEHPTVQKILRFLDRMRTADGYWTDPSHYSPYYPTAKAIMVNAGWRAGDMQPALHWVQSTIHPDGSWGTEQGTAEETAYSLQALCIWKKAGGEVPNELLRRGFDWLQAHREDSYIPLWIGKCLYLPDLIVRSAVLSALMLAEEVL
jgi:halimadienyl-diphosphate synthase